MSTVLEAPYLASERTRRAVQTRSLEKDALAGGGANEMQPQLPSLEVQRAWLVVRQRLESLRSLGDDWDGLGAKAPTDEIVDSAVALLECVREQATLEPPSAVSPSADGTILIVWQEPDGAYFEIEIVRELFAEAMLKRPGHPAEHWTISG